MLAIRLLQQFRPVSLRAHPLLAGEVVDFCVGAEFLQQTKNLGILRTAVLLEIRLGQLMHFVLRVSQIAERDGARRAGQGA